MRIRFDHIALSLIVMFAIDFMVPLVDVLSAQDEAAPAAREDHAAPQVGARDVETVYRHLVEQYTSGRARGVQHVELLHTWSLRICAAEAQEAADSAVELADPDALKESLKGHGKRMKAVEGIAKQLYMKGQVPRADLLAAQILRAQSTRLPAQLAEIIRILTASRELEIEMPEASEASPLLVQSRELFVNIAENGTLSLGGNAASLKEVEELLRQYNVNNPANAAVIIRAAPQARLKHAIDVMNACNRAGIRNYRLTMIRE